MVPLLFYSNDAIVKVLNVGAEDHGSWKEEYYFDNGDLIFIYQNNTYGGAVNPDEFSYQNRYYLHKGRLLKSIESNKDMHLNESDIKELAKTAFKLLKAKNSSEMARIFSCG
ncbi:hypothetical protein [Niabella ginsengisoli]|uniref:Uncharacterized protein n=1 Tax=Niabella ginsengisoli TaxID=522298 RepID=A0ABS9SPH7_9BACT|nr:hypothetical protein [Niabella ginsengisoli]MCH5600271.1 hypothetical protein [Niabella ginsengisoli]